MDAEDRALAIIADNLYRALKMTPCRCVYKRIGVLPVWAEGKRILEQKCARHLATEEYEREILKLPEGVPP